VSLIHADYLPLTFIYILWALMITFVLYRLWCVTCKGIAKSTCHEQRDKLKITDFGKDVLEFDTWLVELQTEAYQGLEDVDGGHGNLELKREQLQKLQEQLQASLKAVEVEIEESEGFRQKLCEIVANCEEMKMLPPTSKASVFMRKNLRQAIADMKQEVQKALVFALNRIRAIPEDKRGQPDEVLVFFLLAFNILKSLNLYFYLLDSCS